MENTEKKLHEMGERMMALIKKQGLSQKDIAEAMEISQGSVSQMCRGQISPTLRWIFEVADLLDTTPAYLIDGVVDDGLRTIPKKGDINAMHDMYKRKIIDSDLYIQFLEKKLQEVAE